MIDEVEHLSGTYIDNKPALSTCCTIVCGKSLRKNYALPKETLSFPVSFKTVCAQIHQHIFQIEELRPEGMPVQQWNAFQLMTPCL